MQEQVDFLKQRESSVDNLWEAYVNGKCPKLEFPTTKPLEFD